MDYDLNKLEQISNQKKELRATIRKTARIGLNSVLSTYFVPEDQCELYKHPDIEDGFIIRRINRMTPDSFSVCRDGKDGRNYYINTEGAEQFLEQYIGDEFAVDVEGGNMFIFAKVKRE